MRLSLFLIVPLYFCISLIGCSHSGNQTTSNTPASVSDPPSVKRADSPAPDLGLAQKSCGDLLPKDKEAYPVSFYPVFVDYSEKNLDLVKKHFCEDSIKKFSQELGKDVVQVASFSSKERADKFKLSLSPHLQGSEVGEHTIVESSKSSGASGTKNLGIAAKLTPQQVNDLNSVVGRGKDFKDKKTSVVLVPTNLPDDYKVAYFETWRPQLSDISGGHYEIVYKNSQDQCFLIGGGVRIPIGDEPEVFEETEVFSPDLGKFKLGYTKSSRIDSKSAIAFTGSLDRLARQNNTYTFSSPIRMPEGKVGNYFHLPKSDINFSKKQLCKMMSFQDAKKVVESLRFLNQ